MQINFHSPGFPIYQTGTARAANPLYFKVFGSTQRGMTKAILGHVKASQVEECSYMIVRRAYREPYLADHVQRRGYGMRAESYRYPRTMYKATKWDYVVARQLWEDGSIEELSAHSTSAEARVAFKAVTGVGVHSKRCHVSDSETMPCGPNDKLLPKIP